ncbi:putative lectin-like protein kinase [Carex littledalei]|uniref:non-specific serine/threonine protein kinase n=1 Tax=Carex littledalei TaxID=544730 RepID=A0A833QUU8_9POAL|nr:putative lectin-like protein kinase [Carex littledalei]
MPLLYLLINVSLANTNTGIHFSYNSTSGWEKINKEGAAYINGGILELSNASSASYCGWATYNKPIPLVDNITGMPASFLTQFTVYIKATNTTIRGDGLTFFLSSYPRIELVNPCGGYLGLFTADNKMDSSQNQVVAVEFDTHRNDWDPTTNHVGIDVNNIYSVVVRNLDDTIPGVIYRKAWVNYSADDQTLRVSLSDVQSSQEPSNTFLSYKVNLTQVLPKTVVVGFSASTGYAAEIHQIHSWEFSTTFGSRKNAPLKAKSIPLIVLVFVLCAIGVTLLLGGFGWFLVWRKKSLKKRGDKRDLPTKYRHKELVVATSNFAPKNKLGEGGFGPVYKGYMRNSCDEVAVKLLKQGSNQGSKEFNTEVETLGKQRHPNLVELFGWCDEKGELLLVYKYMPNGSLNSLLYDKHRLLLWPKRYEIAINLADALCYLHTENEHKKIIVHRDIKPDNVLLDSSLNAKLGDFGLARQVGYSLSANTTNAVGTRGYAAPELFQEEGRIKPSTQSDIYSFGVVLLEIACGRRPVDQNLVQFVWEHYGRNKLLEAADERLRGEYNVKEIERMMFVGLWCSHPGASERPTIGLVRSALLFEDCDLPVHPRSKPIYRSSLSGQSFDGSAIAKLFNSNGTSMGRSQEAIGGA